MGLKKKREPSGSVSSAVAQASLSSGLVPPSSVEFEKVVLGALMLEENLVLQVTDSLSDECFYLERHRLIYRAMLQLASSHSPVDLFTVTERLIKNGDIDLAGGAEYVSSLTLMVGSAVHFDYYVKVIQEKYIKRRMISVSMELQRGGFADSSSAEDVLAAAQQSLFNLEMQGMARNVQPALDVYNDTVDDLLKTQDSGTGLSGLPSGFPDIDRRTLGWQPSDLVIVAARPSMGKTAFVLSMARNMAVDFNIPVAFFSLEMSSKQLMRRLMLGDSGLVPAKINGCMKLSGEDWRRLSDSMAPVANAPLYIDSTPSLSIYEFRSKIRNLVSSYGVRVAFIDYLQLMSGPVEFRGKREQEVSAISRFLKQVAKELDIPVIALSQLSRAVETRGGSRKPQLSDLRESGAIEQDADVVLFIHRPEYYGTLEDPSQEGLAQIIFAKHRNGAVGEELVRFIGSQAKFVPCDEAMFSNGLKKAAEDREIGKWLDLSQPEL